ncbi:MAG: uracil-DNA glycosylase [Oscillospiraceae bacterium]|jgi:DNA polymerase|nr:uracil-DNA glycosylase [Oscillospiraceae bacterium]
MDADWETLRTACEACRACPLGETRGKLVFGVGVQDAKVLFVGEGPGAREDELGEPFVGRSGQLLDQYFAAIGLDRHTNIYIANMVKCRPPLNRDPSPAEQDACLPWLRAQVKILRPKVIVCVGRIAAQRLIRKDFAVTREHGQFFQRGEFLMMGTFHPAALLRNPNQKPAALEDFLALRDKLAELAQLGAPNL